MSEENLDLREITKPLYEANSTETAGEREEERLRNLEKARRELELFDNSLAVKDAKLAEKRDKLLAQADDNTLKDEYGNEIPVAMVKKSFGFFSKEVKETPEERRERLRALVQERYERDRQALQIQRKRAEEKVAYYEKQNVLNMVGQEKHQHSFSEQRRKILKGYLAAAAVSDEGRKFSPGQENLKKTYLSFLAAVRNYAMASSHVGKARLNIDGKRKYKKDQSGRNAELELYAELKQWMEELRKQGQGDPNIMEMLKGYEGLLSSITDGNLVVPKTAKIVKADKKVMIAEDSSNDGSRRIAVDLIPAEKEPLFAHEPTIEDLIQGKLGDCYLITTLGSIVNTEPQIIKNIMKDNGKTVHVRFMNVQVGEDGKLVSTPVYVEVPKVRLKKRGGQGALWVNVMELAWATFSQDQNKYRKALNEARDAMGRTDFNYLKNKAKAGLAGVEEELKKQGRTKYEIQAINEANYVKEMEKQLREDKDAAAGYSAYKKALKEQEEFNRTCLDMTEINGGYAGTPYLAIMGKPMQGTLLRNERGLDYMNRLNYFVDDMLGNYMEQHKMEWSEEAKIIAERKELQEKQKEDTKAYEEFKKDAKIKHDLEKKQDLTPEEKEKLERLQNSLPSDLKAEHSKKKDELKSLQKQIQEAAAQAEYARKKELLGRAFLDKLFMARKALNDDSQGKGKYTQLMTREQLKTELESAAVSLGEEYKTSAALKDAMKEMKEDENFEKEFQKMSEYCRGKKLDAEEEILKQARNMFKFMKDHQEENTVLNYKRFSGKYSKRGRQVFEDLKKNLDARMVITAGTYSLVKGAQSGGSGEYVFDGIASKHAYMVIGTRTETYKSGDEERELLFVKVKNPWNTDGASYEMEDGNLRVKTVESDVLRGECELELNDFMNRYDMLSYGDGKPVELKE